MPTSSRTMCFFVGDERPGIIDFYFACSDSLAYDLRDR